VLARREGDKPLLGEWYVILLPMTIQESSQHKYSGYTIELHLPFMML
jgi:hypothetical protein